ncbi:MAG: right-handed parallel beta-helix repeat-containing protein [Myxococcales bacterium]
MRGPDANRMLGLLAACLGTLAWSPVWGATYFVDFAGGDDTADGTSATTAWKHAPGDSAATANALKALSPGDTVGFKGGVVYKGHLTLGQSGTAQDFITYETSAGWGSGRAIIDGDGWAPGYDRDLSCAILIKNLSYVRVRDLELRNFTTDHSLAGMWWGAGGISVSASDHVEVLGNFVHDMDDYLTNPGSPSGTGIGVDDSQDVKVIGNEVTAVGHTGIYVGGCSDVEVADNDVHDYVVWGLDVVSYPKALSNVVIRDNRIHDLTQYDNLGPHSDYIMVRDTQDLASCKGMSGILIERNLFYNRQTFVDAGGTAMVFMTDNSNDVTIRNNVFLKPRSYVTIEVGWYARNITIVNNTVDGVIALEGTNITCTNNIATALNINISSRSDLNTFSIDHNLYNGGVYASHSVVAFLNDGAYAGDLTLDQWKLDRGGKYDQHSLFTTDPRYADYAALNAHLLFDSPAVNVGADLSALGFAEDLDGVGRPQGAAWDIGAYEYNAATCSAGTPCLSSGGCQTGVIDCSSGYAACGTLTPAPDGTGCAAGLCQGGVCVPATDAGTSGPDASAAAGPDAGAPPGPDASQPGGPDASQPRADGGANPGTDTGIGEEPDGSLSGLDTGPVSAADVGTVRADAGAPSADASFGAVTPGCGCSSTAAGAAPLVLGCALLSLVFGRRHSGGPTNQAAAADTTYVEENGQNG